MTAVIQIKRSQTAAAQPASLAYGELGINITDKKIYIGNSSGATTLLVDGNATSTETIQDAAASLFTSGTHTGISVSYPDTNNSINLVNTGVLSFNSRTGAVTLTSLDVTTALGFTPTAYTAPTLGSTTLTSGTTITTVAGLSSVTSTSFVGALTGNASTVTNGVYTTDTGTVTNTMLAGSIANNKLTNSSVTVNGSSISLGGSATVTATATNALTIGTGLSGSSYNGSTGVTIAIDSTVATLTGNQTLTNKTLTSPTINSPTISNLYLSDGLILVEGTTNDTNEMSLVVSSLTADRTITFPDATGTVVLSTTLGVNKLSAFASTTSAELASVITDETGSGSLVFGTSPTFTTSVIAGSASMDIFNTTATTVNAFNAATTLSLGTSATTFTLGATTGTTTVRNDLNIATGKVYQINATSILSATTLGSSVVSSSLTSVGTIATGVWQGTVIGLTYGGTGKALTASNGGIVWTDADSMEVLAAGTSGYVLTSGGAGTPSWTNATDANTTSAIVQRDGSGNFSAGTITASLTGTASNASAVTMASETSDTTCFLAFVNAASATSQSLKYSSSLAYNASTNYLDVNIDGGTY